MFVPALGDITRIFRADQCFYLLNKWSKSWKGEYIYLPPDNFYQAQKIHENACGFDNLTHPSRSRPQ